jgi:hypothetical protein
MASANGKFKTASRSVKDFFADVRRGEGGRKNQSLSGKAASPKAGE